LASRAALSLDQVVRLGVDLHYLCSAGRMQQPGVGGELMVLALSGSGSLRGQTCRIM
jgi:hypothetical protein